MKKNVHGYDGDGTMGRYIHEMGAARMGHDPKSSVLNKWNQVWGAQNVFVTDGAVMASSNCVKPSLFGNDSQNCIPCGLR